MQRRWQHLLFHNWRLKLFSLFVATTLWITLASESTSEIGIAVPLEYRNVPANTEVISDTADTVEVRLRGPASLIREISPQDISTVIDMQNIAVSTEKVLALTAQHIRAPFGLEVVRVVPARVRVALEPTLSKMLRIIPRIEGTPEAGFRTGGVSVTPEFVEVQGPASGVLPLESIATTPVNISNQRANVVQMVDLDIEDPLIRIPQSAPVRIEVTIRPVQD